MNLNSIAIAAIVALLASSVSVAQEPPMLKSDSWNVETVFTVSETIGNYQPPGILDGLAAYATSTPGQVRILVNHELNPGNGYAYALANGTMLTGARVSEMIVERNGCTPAVVSAALAFDTVYDRNGVVVTNPAQINETGNAIDGFARFCSSQGYPAGRFGFVDDVYFCGEETSKPFHPHGGTEWCIDVAGKDIWALPVLGRAAWENVCALETGDPNRIAILGGDDVESAPLYLYIGEKGALGDGSFLDRNGLAVGQVYVWVDNSGSLTPQDFAGEGSTRIGQFMPITILDAGMAGQNGYDADGYLDGDTLRTAADAMGAFSFSRPEDVHTNPNDGDQFVFASTGRGGLFPADNWGTIYVGDVDFSNLGAGGNIPCTLTIRHDADGLADPDLGIRSPDNLTWGNDGVIYVQEDRSTSPGSLFGASSGFDASIYTLDPATGDFGRIAEVDRTIVRPLDATDIGAGDLGNWETSGIIDVTDLFDTKMGDKLFMVAVQAHGVRNGSIGDNPLLDEGGQIVLMSRRGVMMRGDTAATDNGWQFEPIYTVSESFGGYQPPGILDGIGAYPTGNANEALVLVNHELNPGNGYAYSLANGTMLTGARVSRYVVQRNGCEGEVVSAELAFDTIYDRRGNVVTDPSQINETGNAIDGFARFCSASHVRAGTYGFVDDVFFTGEETSKPFHPHGGTEWALDVAGRDIWALPALGRGAWENVTAVETGSANTVALILGDDTASAPLYLYVGLKNALGDGSFLDRNGLAVGQLYVWVADSGDVDPSGFNGEGAVRTGHFLPITVRDFAMMGAPGHDADGYLDSDTMQALADQLGGFSFSRPEDVHTNPHDGTQVVFASTGRGSLFPDDNWGTIYVIDLDFSGPGIGADLTIIHDADGLADPDTGIRSPDNLTWATDGKIYVQEDRSTSPGSLFGASTGAEASMWQLDPSTLVRRRIGEIDRSVVLPADATDSGAGDLGNWETSGVLDVTDLFDTNPGEVLLIADVQAHGIRNGSIGDNPLLDEGGQLVFVSRRALTHDVSCNELMSGNELRFTIGNGTPGAIYFFPFAVVSAASASAPNGAFFGINLSPAEFATFIGAPFLGNLDSNGGVTFAFNIGGTPCPLGATIDCVVIELVGTEIRASLAKTIDI